MRIGSLISLPNEYSRFGQIRDEAGFNFTVDATQLPKAAKIDADVAYKVDIWENDSGLAYNVEET